MEDHAKGINKSCAVLINRWRWQGQNAGDSGLSLTFSLFLSFVSRQKKEKAKAGRCE